MDDEEEHDDVKKKKHHHHNHHSASKLDIDDDEEEDEDYDEEDEEVSANSQSKSFLQLKNFIADDDEVEYGEEEGSSSLKHEGDEARKKKRWKKHLRELDEEDFDLIQQNTGIEVKKKKRLQKVADQENKAPAESEQEDESRIKVKKDEDGELFESEAADSTSRKRLINSASRRGIQESTNLVDQEQMQRHQKIFGDASALDAKVKQNKKVAAQKERSAAIEESTLEGVYDADELDDQFATKADKEIMARDVPERLQIRIGE